MSDITVVQCTQRIVVDPASNTVSVINAGPMGPRGLTGTGIVDSIVAGENITVDATDIHNPIISSTGGGGGALSDHATTHILGGSDELSLNGAQIVAGIVSDSRIAPTITRDSELTAGLATKADTVHAHVQSDITGLVDSLNSKANISSLGTAAGASIADFDAAGAAATALASANAYTDGVSFDAGGTVDTIIAGTGISINSIDPANPIISATVSVGAAAVWELQRYTAVDEARLAADHVIWYPDSPLLDIPENALADVDLIFSDGLLVSGSSVAIDAVSVAAAGALMTSGGVMSGNVTFPTGTTINTEESGTLAFTVPGSTGAIRFVTNGSSRVWITDEGLALIGSSKLTLAVDPTTDMEAVTKRFLDARIPMPSVDIDVRSYGAVCDNSTICTTAIQNAANAATAIVAPDVSYIKVRLLFPGGGAGYRTDAPITVGAGVQVQMDAPIWCTSTADDTILTIGTQAAYTTGHHRISVRRVTLSSWTSEANIGIKLVNFIRSSIEIDRATSCTIGVKCIGDTKGFAYNEIKIGQLLDNKIALDLDAINVGWVNENTWGGGFGISCSSSTSAAKSRYGIRISSSDASYIGNNNNVFNKPSVEIAGVVFTGGAEAVAFDFPTGALNRVVAGRVESPQMVYAMRCSGSANRNKVELAYASYLSIARPNMGLLDTSDSRSNILDEMSWQFARRGYEIYRSPNLSRSVVSYAGTPAPTSYHIPNVEHWTGTGAARALTVLSNRLLPRDDHVELMSNGQTGVFVDTQVAKRFRLDIIVASTGGRWSVQGYDANGVIMDGSVTPFCWSVESPQSALTWSTGNGGRHTRGSDINAPFLQHSFCVSDAVKTIAVMFGSGTASLKLKGFNIFSLDMPNVQVWSANDGVDRKSTIQPSYGYFNLGEVVKQVDSDGGWVVTTAGVACDTSWVLSTIYALNDVVYNGANVYRCTVAGTSAGSGGPTGTTNPITDNTVTWKWIGAHAVFTKSSSYIEVRPNDNIQSVLTAAPDGSTIGFHTGDYSVTTQLSWSDKELHLIALGRAVFVQAATLTVPLLQATNADDSTIEGLIIQGNETLVTWDGADSERDGIRIVASARTKLENITVTGKSVGIRIDGCTRSRIVSPTITGFGADGISNPNWHWAICVDNTSVDTQITGLNAYNTGSGVINGDSSDGTIIEGGSVVNHWDNAIYISSGNNAIVRGVSIYGPVVTISARPGGIKARGSNHVIEGNIIRRTKVGIALTSSVSGASPDTLGATGDGTVCVGNVIDDVTLDGISIGTGQESGTLYYPRHFKVIGNTIKNTAQSGGTQAAIRGFGHGHKISNNTIDTCGGTTAMLIMAGVTADANIPLAIGVEITDNTFVNSSSNVDCMRLSLLTKAKIKGNVCLDTQTADLVDCRTVTASKIDGNIAPTLGRVVRLDAASTTNRITNNDGTHTITDNNYVDIVGPTNPNSALLPGSVGSIYRQNNGASGSTLWVKESGTGPGGWVSPGAARVFSGTTPPPGMRYLNATVGTVTCPDPGPLTPQVTFVARLRGPTSTATATQVIAAQYSVSGQFSWLIQRNATVSSGRGEFGGSVAGSGTVTPAPVSEVMPITTTADEIIAYTLDSTLSTLTAKRFDGTVWVTVGAGATLAPFTTFDSNSYVRIGAYQTSTNPFQGRIYSVECRSGTDPAGGTLLWKFDASDYPGFGTVYTDPRGQVWTLTSAPAIVANPGVAMIGSSTPDEDDIYIDQTSRVIYVVKNGVWTIVSESGEVNVCAFGAKGDGVTNDAAAIQKAFDFAGPTQFNMSTATVTFDPGDYFVGTTGLTARCSVNMKSGAYLTATGATGVVLLVDSASKAEIKVDIRKAQQWVAGTETSSVGLRVRNSDYVRTRAIVEGFGIGVDLYGDGAGNSYGILDSVSLKDNKIGLRCTGVSAGWGHQHEIRGMFRMTPAYTGVTGTRYVQLVAGNNVTFVNCSFEGDAPEYTAEITSPYSMFLNCRFEGSSPIAYGANSSGGWIIGGYDNYGPLPVGAAGLDIVILSDGTQPGMLSTAGSQIMSSSVGSTEGMIFRSISSGDHGAITTRTPNAAVDALRSQLTHAGRLSLYKGDGKGLGSAPEAIFDLNPVTSRFYIGDGSVAATSYIAPASATVNKFEGLWRFIGAVDLAATGATPAARFGTTSADPGIYVGTGDPNTVVTAPMGSWYVNKSGGAGVSLYVKESGTGNTGWVGK